MRHGIRDDHLLQLGPIEGLNRIAGQNAMRHNGNGILGPVLNHHIGGFDERAAGVRHVVDDNGGFVRHVADEHHFRDFVGPRALFVDEGEGDVQGIGDGCGSGGKMLDLGFLGENWW
jgi:hypothetical protein